MSVKLNGSGRSNANKLISSGNVDKNSSWSFSADDGNKILGDPPDWAKYGKWHLGVDSEADPETKDHWKYPFGKNGKVYRSALTAIRQRAGQQGATDIFNAAGTMINKIDGKSEVQNKEVRSFVFEMEREEEQRKMVGHAAVFNEPADIGGWFSEQIEPGAFKSSIRKDDVRALFNHNPDYVLGRSTSGTLKMSEDEKGLKVSIEPPDTQFARDLAISIERGDISQMSFAFQVLEEEWIRGGKKKQDLRKIKKVQLFDVSPVTFPAYEGTDIAIRSYEVWKSEQESEIEEDQVLESEEKSAFVLISEIEEEKQPQFNLRIHKMRKQLNQRL